MILQGCHQFSNRGACGAHRACAWRSQVRKMMTTFSENGYIQEFGFTIFQWENNNFELHNNIHLNQRVHMGWTTTERIESGVPLLVSPFIHESFNSLLGVWQCLLSMHGPFGYSMTCPFSAMISLCLSTRQIFPNLSSICECTLVGN